MSGLLPDDMKELEGFGTPAGAPKPSVPPTPPPTAPKPPVPTPVVPKPPAAPVVTPPLPAKPPAPPKPVSIAQPAASLPPKPIMPIAPPTPRAVSPAKSSPSTLSDAGSFGGGGGLRVSLMPSELEGRAAPDLRKRLLTLALVLVIETLVFGIAYFFVLRAEAAQTVRKSAATDRGAAVKAQIAKAEADLKDSLAWNAQVAAAKETLDGHVRWTKLFAFLESKTLPTVKYRSFSGDSSSGTVTLDAIGKSYRDVAEQIVTLRAEPMISEVRTSAAAAQVDENGVISGVSFTLALKFKPEAWINKPITATR